MTQRRSSLLYVYFSCYCTHTHTHTHTHTQKSDLKKEEKENEILVGSKKNESCYLFGDLFKINITIDFLGNIIS